MSAPGLPGWSRRFQPLRGWHVVELGDAVTTAVAGWVLRSLGASVTHVRLAGQPAVADDAGDPAAVGSSAARSLRLLHSGVATVDSAAEHLDDLLDPARVDVVLCDTGGGSPSPEGSTTVADHLARVQSIGVRAWVSVAPFGLSGPLAGQPAAELVTLAASGLLNYTRGSGDEPVVPAGFQAAVATGHIAALAAVDALSRSATSGQPVHLEVSAQEAVIATSVVLEVAHELFGLAGEPGTGRYGPPRGLLSCADGHLYLSILEDHHWRRLAAALGTPPWAADIPDLATARTHGAKIMERLRGWAGDRTRDSLVEQLQRAGVPATAVHSCWELLDDAAYLRPGFIDHGDGRAVLPRVPLLSRGGPPPRAAARRQLRGLTGCRVADLSHVLAGPLATSWLGAMGADVVRLEERHRLDIYRRRGPRPPQPWPGAPDPLELSGYFAVTNHTKRSVTTGSDTGAGPRQRLLAAADVVVENLSGHRRTLLGLDFDAFRAGGHRATMISSSGFGRTGPRAGYRVYGTNLHCHSGIVFHTRDPAGQVCNIGAAAWADPITSIWIALLAAAGHVTGSPPADIDISMAEVATRHLFDHLAVAATAPPPPMAGSAAATSPPIVTHRPPYAVLPARDGPVMVVVAGPDQWHGLCRWRPDLASASQPEGWQAAADRALAGLARHRLSVPATELVAALRRHGVPAHQVLDAAGLAADPHLAARGFFAEVEHPGWGRQRMVGLPWRVAGGPPVPLRGTPLLGEHDLSWRDDRAWDAPMP